MKVTCTLLAMCLVGISISACGNTDGGTGSTSRESSDATSTVTPAKSQALTPAGAYLKVDGDSDSDDEKHTGRRPDDDDDRDLLAPYPNTPGQAERRAITTLVKSYYIAAAAQDGTKACVLLDASLATGLGEGADQPGQSKDNRCVASMSHLFKEEHQRLAADEVATMSVTSVHVKDGLGLALLGFRKMPEGEMFIEREGHTWKIGALFDSEPP
jgi:hypothetical protein